MYFFTFHCAETAVMKELNEFSAQLGKGSCQASGPPRLATAGAFARAAAGGAGREARF